MWLAVVRRRNMYQRTENLLALDFEDVPKNLSLETVAPDYKRNRTMVMKFIFNLLR